jgi:hypothetical protein
VIGGRTQDQILDITQIFYPDDSRWEDAAPLNTARYSFAAATVGDTVLVFGGLGDQGVPLSSVERLKALGTAAEGPVPPPDLTLGPPFPHPFSQETRFDYSVSLSASSHVTIQILDVTGRTVKTLIDGPQIPGLSQAVWRGDTDAGTRVANGLYIIRMRQGPFSIVRKAVRVGG